MAQGLKLTLVVVPSTTTVTLEQQASLAVGGVKFHAKPLLTVMLLAQVNSGGVVSTTVTVWLQVLLLPQASVNSQVRVIICGQTARVATPFVTCGSKAGGAPARV